MLNTGPELTVSALPKRVHVVAGIIWRGDSILLARRPEHVHQGGLWEFPGGKLEAGESPEQGLSRELQEELSIQVRCCELLQIIEHDYPDKQVRLEFWSVVDFAGEPAGLEGQEVRWVLREHLPDFDFPAANQPIVTRLLTLGR